MLVQRGLICGMLLRICKHPRAVKHGSGAGLGLPSNPHKCCYITEIIVAKVCSRVYRDWGVHRPMFTRRKNCIDNEQLALADRLLFTVNMNAA